MKKCWESLCKTLTLYLRTIYSQVRTATGGVTSFTRPDLSSFTRPNQGDIKYSK